MISARLRQRAIDALLDHVAWLEGKRDQPVFSRVSSETRDVADRAYNVANPGLGGWEWGGWDRASIMQRYAAAASLLAAGWYPGWEDGP